MSNAKKKIKDFTDLLAWKEAHALVLLVYRETKLFPKDELFGLTSQMRRAAISVTSNIAEGFGRRSLKEKTQFYYVAQGSLTELKNQLLIATDVGYLKPNLYKKMYEQACTAHKLLQGLLQKTRSLTS